MNVLAPAKINIGLRVIRKRSDTYHDIETIFYPIHLADELEITKSERHEFFSNIHIDPRVNLCLRALHFFCERTGINAEVKIVLKKNIPIGGGLGGGSSDAAAVLLALQELYGKPLSEIELRDIADQLGSDVPFFLKRTPSYATGKGEILQPIKYKITKYILTVTPDILVPTPLAYSMVTPIENSAGEKESKGRSLCDSLLELGENFPGYKNTIVNDFETTVFKKFPIIEKIKSEMYNQGAEFALMSGSGSSVYGFFGSEASADRASNILKEKFILRVTDVTPPRTVA